MTSDIRWQQRFDNYVRAYTELREIHDLAATRPLSRLEKQGVIQCFEYTHELAWNVLKDYLEYQGHVGLIGSRDSVREAFRRGLVQDGDVWMSMIKARNITSHAYDQTTADTIYSQILTTFYPVFCELHDEFTRRRNESL